MKTECLHSNAVSGGTPRTNDITDDGPSTHPNHPSGQVMRCFWIKSAQDKIEQNSIEQRRILVLHHR
jgi:hypothetical protein